MAAESKIISKTEGYKLSCGTCTHVKRSNNDTLDCDDCSLTPPQVAESKSVVPINDAYASDEKGGSRKPKKKTKKRKTKKRKRRTNKKRYRHL
jgi:hypothetical protein